MIILIENLQGLYFKYFFIISYKCQKKDIWLNMEVTSRLLLHPHLYCLDFLLAVNEIQERTGT